ncbi:helix-turn-helix domain-containing protein [Neisseria sp. S1]|uniref:helix-turn-helix domain-containing protein n=1 Tax=Neisseria sp. S1 TaxID=3318354 RepID=UPI003A83F146
MKADIMSATEIYHLRRSIRLSGAKRFHTTTQREFADILGVSLDAVKAWEQGRRRPRAAAVTLLNLIRRNPAIVETMKVD